MALNAYLRLTGETQGDIRGGVTQAGREDSIAVFAMAHEITSPRDAASGRATGHRRHVPITLTKDVDKASPLLLSVLVNNENITTFRLEFFRPTRAGTEEQFYTIELHNASISGIRTEMLNNKYPENMRLAEREHISFAYERITWTFEDGGITAQDDWEAPTA